MWQGVVLGTYSDNIKQTPYWFEIKMFAVREACGTSNADI